MYEILVKLSPVFLFFLLGILLKKIRFADTDQADFLLRFVFFISLPALVLLNLSKMPLSADKIYLPFINAAVNLACMGITIFSLKPLNIPARTLGAILMCTMIANNVFMFPFILAGFGSAGFTDAVLFDFGNGLTTATVTYLTAFRYGPDSVRAMTMLIKLVRSPLFWSFVIAIVMNLLSVPMPEPFTMFLNGAGQMTSPLILIALGIFFQPQFSDLKLVSFTILLRSGAGLAVGAGLARLAGISGQTLSVIMLCSAAPVGFMALTFSSLAGLDRAFASKTVSLSILLGVIYVPILMYLFGVQP